MLLSPLVLFLIIIGFFLFSAVKILPEWERGVVLRLGRSVGVRGPGLILLVPIIERMVRVDTRTIVMDIQPQDVITLDNVSMKVNAVVYFRVIDTEKAVTQIEDFYFATSQLAQTTLRSTLGQYQMDEILSMRDKINHSLQTILDKATEPWGIKIANVEVKHIDLPKEMQRAMARQAEAERERRAKVISAEGEFQRAEKLKDASNILSQSPAALQLAYLQALREISGEGTKTVIFPLPVDMISSAFDKSYFPFKTWGMSFSILACVLAVIAGLPAQALSSHIPSEVRVRIGVHKERLKVSGFFLKTSPYLNLTKSS
ncbi:MAG: slipin family protein, partial [Bdellovibrionales bacterium]|nr:slipin family protein [Bdellovibrionales bacterium]